MLFQVVKDFTDSETNIWYEDIPIPVEPNVFLLTNSLPLTRASPTALLLLYDTWRQSANTEKHWASSRVEMPRPGKS